MARYRIAHDLDRTWVSRNEDGTFSWVEGYDKAHLFQNFKEARAALDTLPVEKRMYGFPYKPNFMKFYDSDEHYKKEQDYLANKRLLREWGEI